MKEKWKKVSSMNTPRSDLRRLVLTKNLRNWRMACQLAHCRKIRSK